MRSVCVHEQELAAEDLRGEDQKDHEQGGSPLETPRARTNRALE